MSGIDEKLSYIAIGMNLVLLVEGLVWSIYWLVLATAGLGAVALWNAMRGGKNGD